MRFGMVISGGDVTGINNFVFQLGRLTQAEIVIFDGGIPGLLANNHRDISQRDLLDFSIAPIPVMQSGRTQKKLVRNEYECIARQLKSARIEVLIMAGGDGSLQFLHTLAESRDK